MFQACPRYISHASLPRAAGEAARRRFKRLPCRKRQAQAVAIAAPPDGQSRITGKPCRRALAHLAPGRLQSYFMTACTAPPWPPPDQPSLRSGAPPPEERQAAIKRPPAQRHPRVSPLAASNSRFAGEGADARQEASSTTETRRHGEGRGRRGIPTLLRVSVSPWWTLLLRLPRPVAGKTRIAVRAVRGRSGDRAVFRCNSPPRPGRSKADAGGSRARAEHLTALGRVTQCGTMGRDGRGGRDNRGRRGCGATNASSRGMRGNRGVHAMALVRRPPAPPPPWRRRGRLPSCASGSAR